MPRTLPEEPSAQPRSHEIPIRLLILSYVLLLRFILLAYNFGESWADSSLETHSLELKLHYLLAFTNHSPGFESPSNDSNPKEKLQSFKARISQTWSERRFIERTQAVDIVGTAFRNGMVGKQMLVSCESSIFRLDIVTIATCCRLPSFRIPRLTPCGVISHLVSLQTDAALVSLRSEVTLVCYGGDDPLDAKMRVNLHTCGNLRRVQEQLQ
ncbi:uncharacterized protein BDR25DRAFT_348733 [Lindgomyces ingoldianus]|uniref:Uncharacterized protein n=1 Tax=Lindgomyces ingoldianus TaxID=673940 RepID=A0ACB6RBV7_9PLEO|nr:uncharacterized protein BDR25DRAFT_348733 [Lindgomyces ingoldianus]KAF2476808.1 hypothetical protein BDR25DRAFT_348733 [Lindgomyces ingoldianus]